MHSNFMFVFLLHSILFSVIFSGCCDVIPKYGSKKTDDGKAVLNTSDFAVGDKIYISVTYYYCHCIGYNYLHYGFYESIEDKTSLSTDSYVDSSSSSSYEYFGSCEYTYNYKIKKQNNNDNYLYMESSCDPPVLFENTEDDVSKTILIVSIVCAIIFVVIMILIIYFCCCRRGQRRCCCGYTTYGTVSYAQSPAIPVYNVSPYGAQPVVGVNVVQPVPITNGQPAQPITNGQPYYNYGPNQNYNQNANNQDVQYNSASAGQGSDYRINQGAKYEKPH